MLDYADLVVVNKYEKKGSEDAIRDVRKQVQRNRKAWDKDPKQMPVYGTIASKFNDDGITAFTTPCWIRSTRPRHPIQLIHSPH